MKKTIAITTAAIIFVCFSSINASAGAARRHTIEGIMIGTGVAMLGAAIYNEIHHNDAPKYARHSEPDRSHKGRSYDRGHKERYNRHHPKYYAHKKHHRKFNSHRPGGYWKIEKIWVAPVYKKRWKQGHYNHRGEWKSSRHRKFLVRDGYYKTNKVWVRH